MRENADSVVRFFISVIGIVFLAIILMELKSILIPYVLAVFFLFLLDPLHQKLKQKKIPLAVSIILDLIIFALIIYGISAFVIGAVDQFVATLPFYEIKLSGMLEDITKALNLESIDLTKLNILALFKQLNLGSFAQNILSSTVDVASAIFLILLFYVFSVLGHENFQRAFRKRMKFANANKEVEKKVKNWDVTYEAITKKIQHYFIVKFLLGVGLAIGTGIVLWLFGVHFVIVWSVLTFLSYFIPTIGPFIAVLFPTLIALIQYQSFGYAFFLLLSLVGLQTVVGNILEPKILGNQLNINPLVILLSLFIWGYIWGIIGMLLAVPIMSTIKIIISQSDSPNLQLLDNIMSSHFYDE